MYFRYKRSYQGGIRGVVFDWAGTTVDYGCFAPTVVFIDLFRKFGVGISVSEARAPMGGHKRDHLREILMMETVSERWRAAHGKTPSEADVDALFKEFVPAQVVAVTRHANIIPGCRETCTWLREHDIRIGSSTGYSREIMEPLIKAAADHGFKPDYVVCADEVPCSRPAPWMCFENARQFNIFPMEAMVKVGDTVPDIEEGLNAGMWTVGVAVTGNEMGMTESEVNTLPSREFQERRCLAHTRLARAGAHYVIDGISGLPEVISDIRKRLDAGRHPATP